MISLATIFGGARYTGTGTSIDLFWNGARVHTVNATAGSLTVDLPPANSNALGEGGPAFYVLNVGSNAFDLRDSAGGAVVTIPAGDGAIITLRDNSTAAGSWGYVLRDIL